MSIYIGIGESGRVGTPDSFRLKALYKHGYNEGVGKQMPDSFRLKIYINTEIMRG